MNFYLSFPFRIHGNSESQLEVTFFGNSETTALQIFVSSLSFDSPLTTNKTSSIDTCAKPNKQLVYAKSVFLCGTTVHLDRILCVASVRHDFVSSETTRANLAVESLYDS